MHSFAVHWLPINNGIRIPAAFCVKGTGFQKRKLQILQLLERSSYTIMVVFRPRGRIEFWYRWAQYSPAKLMYTLCRVFHLFSCQLKVPSLSKIVGWTKSLISSSEKRFFILTPYSGWFIFRLAPLWVETDNIPIGQLQLFERSMMNLYFRQTNSSLLLLSRVQRVLFCIWKHLGRGQQTAKMYHLSGRYKTELCTWTSYNSYVCSPKEVTQSFKVHLILTFLIMKLHIKNCTYIIGWGHFLCTCMTLYVVIFCLFTSFHLQRNVTTV